MTQLYSNNVDVALEQAASLSDTSLVLTDGSGLQSPGVDEFELLTLSYQGIYEIVKVTARSSNTVTVDRAQEGTTARDWPKGARVYASVTAASLSSMLTQVAPADLVASVAPTDGQVPTFDLASGDWVWETVVGGGSTTLTGLTDTPADYTGATSGDLLRINSTADGVEFSSGGVLIDAGVANSIEIDASSVQLVGDAVSPGANQVYGTDAAGNKGWKADPAGGSVTVKNSIEEDVGSLQLVGDASAPGNDMVYGTNGSGVKGWQSPLAAGWSPTQTVQDNLTAFAPMSLPAGTTAFGINAISIQPSRNFDVQVAAGENSIAIGTGSQIDANAASSIAIGRAVIDDYNGSADGAIAIGDGAYSASDQAVALGWNAHADLGNAVALGSAAYAEGENSTAIGPSSAAYKPNSISVGNSMSDHNYAFVGGTAMESQFDGHRAVIGLPAAREASWSPFPAGAPYYAHRLTDSVIILTQGVLCIGATSAGITLPGNIRFFPDEVGAIVLQFDSVTTLPNVSFGSSTSAKADMLASSPMSGLTTVGDRIRWTSLASDKGVKELWYDVDATGAGTTLLVRFYWKGFAVVDEV